MYRGSAPSSILSSTYKCSTRNSVEALYKALYKALYIAVLRIIGLLWRLYIKALYRALCRASYRASYRALYRASCRASYRALYRASCRASCRALVNIFSFSTNQIPPFYLFIYTFLYIKYYYKGYFGPYTGARPRDSQGSPRLAFGQPLVPPYKLLELAPLPPLSVRLSPYEAGAYPHYYIVLFYRLSYNLCSACLLPTIYLGRYAL